MENLKYRRQFLLSSQPCKKLKSWRVDDLGSLFLYCHPDNNVERRSTDVADFVLIGDIINPHYPNKTNEQLLEEISKHDDEKKVSNSLYPLVGRFVLIIQRKKSLVMFHDPCGLKSIFYTKFNNNFYAASQPLLLNEVIPLTKGKKFKEYNESEYKKRYSEHWLPSGCSLYNDVYHLVPNHYLNTNDFKQIRYWPTKRIEKNELTQGVKNFAYIFKNTLIAANKRFDIALPVTAGWDSRILLSACKEIAGDIFFYTFLYRKLSLESSDISIPKRILNKQGLVHNVMDCNMKIDENFLKIYSENSDMSHLNDWGYIASGIHSQFPKSKTAVKGNCAEIGRCVYYDLTEINPDLNTYHGLLNLHTDGWSDMGFICQAVENWYKEIIDSKFNYNLLDLFYWEQRMGSWQAQAQLEWDILFDSFTPFNNRELIDVMLSVDERYRKKKSKYLFFQKVIENLWSEILREPINPKSMGFKFRAYGRMILKKTGTYGTIRKFVRNVN